MPEDIVDIPVEAVSELGRKYRKSKVIVIAVDTVANRTHLVTWALLPEHKFITAQTGERIMTALGVDMSNPSISEDWRLRPQAEAAKTIDDLRAEVRRLTDELEKANDPGRWARGETIS